VFYSHRLGEIPDTSLQAALDRFGLGELVATRSIPFGLFGQNLFMTATTGDYVFRGSPHYAWQLPTERHFAGLLHAETSVPVPWPYLETTDSAPFSWPWGFAIMPRLPGLLLADPAVYDPLSPVQRSRLARAQGALLWQLQRAPCPAAGAWDIDTGAIRPFPHGYVRRTHDRIEANATAAFANGGHSPEDHAWLASLLASLRALPEPDRYTVSTRTSTATT
jgi:hygromycin-B 7''-O-kinase